ncbi:putative ribosome associated DnaJ chaperone Zuotin [Pseudomassariella vexata]|uniref:Putative ribosome associated DnaJ chaperone Zuotin n=1 Tax=Pseudomassariella vexata TaxID=1141098 RepID=A0A1Y2E9N7_9PEZI|nr:putative ribosome associated DnaJ chaperone Zuotin [Pseudomassariella vexata]ORY67575.1 putative ribosome associated DnaJ chaperone Zuotin [Pseudomassariella vexata]
MTTATVVSKPIPALAEGWSAEKDFKPLSSITSSSQRTIEPVGPHFLAHARRARHKRTFSEDDRIQAQEKAKNIEKDDDDDVSEPEDPMMLQREAKDWKSQDHYQVLGLSKYRYKATEDQIKRAHRKKVLKHHPDKKAALGATEDDNFFKCIQKATEVLLDPVKRRQFDSVDEKADVEPPSKKDASKNFYKLWSRVFKAEARFSKTQPVPSFGGEDATKEEVDAFYNFWYNFDSWRSFEYLDEDVPDDNENRDQKRHMERKNTNARKKKKAEDNARLRKMLDECSAGDERIKRFRQQANAAKNKKKFEKEEAERKAKEDARLKKEAEEKAAKEAEEKAKTDREANKKAKEAAKNAVKKNKRVLKGSVKDANYFSSGGDASASQIDAVLGDVETVQGKVDPDEIAALAAKLNGLKVADEIKAVWKGEVERLVAAGKLKDGDCKSFI